MRRPGDESKEPDGGRAAERLREFLRDRLPTTGEDGKAGSDPGCGPADTKRANRPGGAGATRKAQQRSGAKKK
jgi:hypothetical protein